MIKNIKSIVALALVAGMAFGAASCNKEDDNAGNNNNQNNSTITDNQIDSTAAAITTQFVDHTVAPTYTALAAYAEQLANQIADLKAQPSQSALETACETFLNARAEWEKSEAFLFGAASDKGIDPHIDSWPFDESYFNSLMSSPAMLETLKGDDADEQAYVTLSEANLGFHSLEYIMFQNGQPKQIANISANEWVYANAVAGDLRNNCYLLEVCWLGDQAPKSHIDKLDDLEWGYTLTGSDASYGENIKNAGLPGSTYASRVSSLISIVGGCVDIADEVGSSKINSAYAMGDTTYIESPYSHMSITDFHNNIVSIQNVWFGGIEGQRNTAASLSTFVKSINAELAAEVEAAIANAIAKIDAMPKPFVNNVHASENGAAVEACNALSETLAKVSDALSDL